MCFNSAYPFYFYIMTQEEKQQLLLKDLCARLSYGIFVKENRESLDDGPTIYTFDYHPYIDNCKPYLRPMSNMTEEELNELHNLLVEAANDDNRIALLFTIELDYYNSHHLDYRGLIPMGLALPAPEDMYN